MTMTVKIEDLRIGQEVEYRRHFDGAWAKGPVGSLTRNGFGYNKPTAWVNGAAYPVEDLRVVPVRNVVFTSEHGTFVEGEPVMVRRDDGWETVRLLRRAYSPGGRGVIIQPQKGLQFETDIDHVRKVKKNPHAGYTAHASMGLGHFKPDPKVVFTNETGESFVEGEEVEVNSICGPGPWRMVAATEGACVTNGRSYLLAGLKEVGLRKKPDSSPKVVFTNEQGSFTEGEEVLYSVDLRDWSPGWFVRRMTLGNLVQLENPAQGRTIEAAVREVRKKHNADYQTFATPEEGVKLKKGAQITNDPAVAQQIRDAAGYDPMTADRNSPNDRSPDVSGSKYSDWKEEFRSLPAGSQVEQLRSILGGDGYNRLSNMVIAGAWNDEVIIPVNQETAKEWRLDPLFLAAIHAPQAVPDWFDPEGIERVPACPNYKELPKELQNLAYSWLEGDVTDEIAFQKARDIEQQSGKGATRHDFDAFVQGVKRFKNKNEGRVERNARRVMGQWAWAWAKLIVESDPRLPPPASTVTTGTDASK